MAGRYGGRISNIIPLSQTQAIAMANKLQESKNSVKAQQVTKKRKSPGVNVGAQKLKQKRPAVSSRHAQLRKEVEKRMASKGKGGGAGRGGRQLVVIPAAFGRDTQGTDALAALRTKMALIS